MLTIDRVKLIDDHRFSLLTLPTMNSKQDNGLAATIQQQPNAEISADGVDWSLALSEPSDSDSGE